MTASILNGKALANSLQQTLKNTIQTHLQKGFPRPGLAVILANDSPASAIYVRNKRRACQTLGFQPFNYDLPPQISEQALLTLIDTLNHDQSIHGILVQLPLPPHIQTQAILEHIFPHKDVDGFHPYNLGRLAQKHPTMRPCTPYGIIQLLQHYQLPIHGKHAVIIGASTIVGRPMALEMLLQGATTTVCHRATPSLQPYVESADILIIATGTRGCVDPDWLQSHQIVVDVGMHQLDNGQLCGDLDFHTAKEKVAWISPVPGGVGPMTITALLQNTLTAAILGSA